MKNTILVIAISLLSISVFAQNNIGIGTITPNAKSVLDLNANDKGFLVPRLTSAERINISPIGNADAALLVYDTDDNLFYFWNSTQWVSFPQAAGSNNISLSFDANTGTLSLTDNGGTLTTNIPPDNDNDPTNEVQQLTLNNNILNLSLSNNNISLAPYLDNTDEQTLSLSGNTLSISNGNSVVLPEFPQGIICMWSGNVNNIPTGWALCNGNNGTPDLRDRFIVGAGNNYAIGNTGGADTITLTQAQIPAHTHTGTTNISGEHTHAYTDFNPETPYLNDGYSVPGNGFGTNRFNHNKVTSPAGNHEHTFTTNATGGGQPFDNRPVYYALAYIIKL